METTVETAYGRMAGDREGLLHVFRGIPFAKPPVGKLRFRAPEPPLPWEGVRSAKAYGAWAPQAAGGMFGQMLGMEAPTTSEDCLTLNVWTPGLDSAKRPVMVWIHGGAFVLGSGAQAWYKGNTLATRGDIVVVTVNYRLGALGYLHLSDLCGNGFASNAAVLDQIAALEWVRDNIGAFGGDPANVTIFGESAGGMSVGTLLGTPRAKGLFSRAILESGAAHNITGGERSQELAETFLSELGLLPGNAAELSDVPVDKIVEAQGRLMLRMSGRAVGALPFQPAVDGDLIGEQPLEAIRAGLAREVAVLVGTTLDEAKLFSFMDPGFATLDDARLVERCDERIPGGAAIVDAYRKPGREDAKMIWQAIDTDRVFRIPAIRLAEAQSALQADVYSYLFAWPSPAMGGMLGACHAVELPFVFGTLGEPGAAVFAGEGDLAQSLSDCCVDAWTAFARSGRPAHPSLPEWPGYTTDRRATMVLDRKCRIEDDPLSAERSYWEGRL